MIQQCLKTLFLICLIIPLITSCTSKKIIINGLDEKEANEILVFLSGKGIEANKVAAEGGGGGGGKKEALWDIQVKSEQASEALYLLNQYGLPRKKGQSLLGIFKEGSGLVPSEMQEKVKYQAGIAEQIANTLRKIDGVLDAEVQLSFPEEDPLNLIKNKQPITASVFIKHNGVLDDPNSHLESKIKRLVAASVTGLDYDNVTVVGTRARMSDFGTAQNVGEEEKPFVNVWSIIIAKESVTTFRIIFFTFILVLLMLTLMLIWMCWKLVPVLHNHGGLRALFSLHPIEEKKPAEKKPGEEGKEGEEGAESADKKGPPSEVT